MNNFCSQSHLKLSSSVTGLVSQALHAVVQHLRREVDELNRLDAVVSDDGDIGTTFLQAADTIERDWTNGRLVLY